MKIATVGLDIAKQVFQVHAADAEGRAVLRRRLRRNQVATFFANLPPCVIGQVEQERCQRRRGHL